MLNDYLEMNIYIYINHILNYYLEMNLYKPYFKRLFRHKGEAVDLIVIFAKKEATTPFNMITRHDKTRKPLLFMSIW